MEGSARTTADLERLWAKIRDGASVTVILEPDPQRLGAPVGLAPSTRRTTVILVPPEQSADPAGLLQQAHQDSTDCIRGCLAGLAVSRLHPRRPAWHRQPRSGGVTANCAPAAPPLPAWSSAAVPPACASTPSSSCSDRVGPTPSDRSTSSKTALVGMLEKYADPRGAQAARAGPARRLVPSCSSAGTLARGQGR